MNGRLPLERRQWALPVLGAVVLLVWLLAGWSLPQQALLSYLLAYVFWTGLTLGSLALVMVHALTGGAWGESIRPQLLAAARTLPLQALLVLPILFGMRILYPWTQPEVLAGDAQLRAQAWYLDGSFFVIRTIVWFVLWLGMWLALERRLADPARLPHLQRLAGPGLIVYSLTMSLAATDWVMSLLPHWHSSIFGMLVVTGQMLAAAALATWIATRRARAEPAPPGLLCDLGNLLLMFVLAWTYLAFMQYLTVWIADLPAETNWYIPRTLTTWRWLAWFLIAFQFVVPFAILLSQRAKRAARWLGAVAAMLLVASVAHALWLVVPNFRPQGFAIRWTDPLAVLGIGMLWVFLYAGQLRAVPLTPWPSPPQLSRGSRRPGTEASKGSPGRANPPRERDRG